MAEGSEGTMSEGDPPVAAQVVSGQLEMPGHPEMRRLANHPWRQQTSRARAHGGEQTRQRLLTGGRRRSAPPNPLEAKDTWR